MPAGASAMEGNGLEHAPFSAEFQAAVRAELDTMLKAPIFVQSNRCKRFLSYVVLQTLAGNAGELKERTIGISVFDRTNDYDTGDDSIVRVTANEVRKRLGQFYRESPGGHPIQIELPRGSYVPEFRVLASRPLPKPVEIAASDHTHVEPELPVTPGSPASSSVLSIHPEPSAGRSQTRRRAAYASVFLLLGAVVAGLGILKAKESGTVPDLWAAFLQAKVPVLLCIDTHNLQPLAPEQPGDAQRFVDLVLRRQIISLDDAAILSSMASELGKRGIPYRVAGAEQISLTDFRRQPVILIGAIDNKWTLRLTQNLPYRVEVVNPPGSGSAREPIASIVESARPAGARWVTDLSVPFTAWKSDYAIVARVADATTGVPVMIEAGLGNDGTVAASELITSGAITNRLAQEPSCKDKSNFEAVIETQIIDTKSGPPHVLRLACW